MSIKRASVLLIVLLAMFTPACQSIPDLDFGITEFFQDRNQSEVPESWPKLRVGSVRSVENTGQLVVPIEAIRNALQGNRSVLPPLPLEPVVSISKSEPAAAQLFVSEILPVISNQEAEELILQKFFSPNLSGNVLQLPAGTLRQINSFHLSTEQLETITIAVNGQPLFASEEIPSGQTFPSRLLDISLCTDHQWQNTGNGLMLLCSRMEKVNTIFPSQTIPTKGMMLSLVMVGHVPGTYNLSLSTTDAAGREQEIVQKIEVTEPAQ